MRTLIAGGAILQPGRDGADVLRGHTVVIENGIIREVAAAPVTPAQGDEVIDGSNHLILPGLINTHHHLYQSLTRAIPGAQNASLFDWLSFLYERWRVVTFEAVRAAASVSIAELLLSGCTATSDHFYLFPPGSDVRVEAVVEAADALGIRLHLCRGSMSLGKAAGGLPPDDIVEPEEAILADCQRVVERYHDPDPLAMRRVDLAPCSPFNVSEGLLRDTRDFARERGLLLHTHAAETLDEERYCLERFGKRPIEFLFDLDWLGPDVYLAHCVQLNGEDIARIAASGTSVAHCPCSNMRLGSGIAPIRRLIEQGVTVSIGVDGSSSNDGGNVLAEARQALLLQRVAWGAAAMKPAEALAMATIGGAKCLAREKLGRIAPGMAADIAMFRRDELAIAGAVEHDPVGALVLCQAPQADRVLVGGRTVVADGHLVHADERSLARELNAAVRKIF